MTVAQRNKVSGSATALFALRSVFLNDKILFMVETPPPVRNEKLVLYLKPRSELIDHLIASDEVYTPRTRVGAFLVGFLARSCISPGSEFIGRQNLELAIRAFEGGQSVSTASNHESDSDHTIRRFVFEQGGYGDFVNRTVYAAGLKMRERGEINRLSGSENQLYIPTPFDMADLKEARRNRDLYTAEEFEAMKKLSLNYHDLIDVSKAKLKNLVAPGPERMSLGVYPEGTRSRDGYLGPARRETANWYTQQPDGFILPIAVGGGYLLLPPEKPQLLSKRFIRDKAVTSVAVGPMIETAKIIAFTQGFGQPAQMFVDCVMAHVAVLMGPKRVSAQRWASLIKVKADFESFCGQQKRLRAV
jgi:hypothetical protein